MVNYLYIHIPFCIRKCIYCDFLSVPYDEVLAMRYTTAVLKELELRSDTARTLNTVYIGGGTPTAIPTLALIRLLKTTKDLFEIAQGIEITIEANPGTISKEIVRALSESGVNRFSIGVQSFNDDELKLLGRIHDFSGALSSISAARYSGITNVSIDLIYGIPGQTLDGWSRTVLQAIEISSEHISAYELTPERGTPLYESILQKKLRKPDEETIIEMYYHAIDKFAEAGYRHYEISNFAKPGFECRHNLNYWNRGEYIGIGAGAHSFIADMRTRNTGDIEKYIQALHKGNLPVEQRDKVSQGDALKESIFLGLRKTEGLNIREFRENLGIDILKPSHELIERGLLMNDRDYLRLTREGIVVSNSVIVELLELLAAHHDPDLKNVI